MGKWEMVRLGEIADLITKGTTPTTLGYDFQTEGVNFIKIESITERGAFIPGKFQHISEECHEKLKRSVLKKNDILFSIAGALGRVAIVPDSVLPANINQALAIIRISSDQVYLRYVAIALRSNLVFEQFQRQKQGVAQLNLSLKNVAEIEIPLPPLEVQRNIADVLDRAGVLVEKREVQLDKLDLLIKSQFIELFGDPVTNPKGWEMVSLSEIAEYYNGLTYSPEDVSKEGVVVLRSSNIQGDTLAFDDTVRVNRPIKDKFLVKENDILMCARNGSARLVGKVALIPRLNEKMAFGTFMMIIRSKHYLYLMTYFQSKAFRRQIAIGATTTINQVTGAMLDKIQLPLPPAQEMPQFAAFVRQVEAQKSLLQQSLAKLELNYKSLMQKCFRGEIF